MWTNHPWFEHATAKATSTLIDFHIGQKEFLRFGSSLGCARKKGIHQDIRVSHTVLHGHHPRFRINLLRESLRRSARRVRLDDEHDSIDPAHGFRVGGRTHGHCAPGPGVFDDNSLFRYQFRPLRFVIDQNNVVAALCKVRREKAAHRAGPHYRQFHVIASP